MLDKKNCIDLITQLSQKFTPLDINWESTLEAGYKLFLNSTSTVIDIGAHSGRHSDVFINSIKCKKAYLFEPQSTLYQKLKQKYSSYDNVIVYDIALTKLKGISSFVLNKNAPEESGLKERLYNNPTTKSLEQCTVSTDSLDNLFRDLEVADNLYIKIDTEGGEMDILLGGVNLIKRQQPIISVEYGQASYSVYGYTDKSLFEFCINADYTIFDLFGNSIEEIDSWRRCVNSFYWDYYLVPNSQKEQFNNTLVGKVQPIINYKQSQSQKISIGCNDFLEINFQLSDEQFINNTYQQYLGRQPDESGKMFYLTQFNTYSITRETFLQIIINSQEYRSRN